MSEVTKEQKLEQQVVILKSRVFDANEVAQRIKDDNDQLRGILSKIVEAAGVEAAEDGTVDIAALIKTISDKFAE